MKDKTIEDIASIKIIQEAFIARLNPTAEERLHPKQFVMKYLKTHIQEIVNAHKQDEAARIARADAIAKDSFVL